MYQHLYRNKYLDTQPRCIKTKRLDGRCNNYVQGLCTLTAGKCRYQFFPIVLEKDLPKVAEVVA